MSKTTGTNNRITKCYSHSRSNSSYSPSSPSNINLHRPIRSTPHIPIFPNQSLHIASHNSLSSRSKLSLSLFLSHTHTQHTHNISVERENWVLDFQFCPWWRDPSPEDQVLDILAMPTGDVTEGNKV